jgi:hypothetical protein
MQSTRTRLGLESLDHRIVPARIDLRAAGSEALLAGGAIAHRIDGAWNNLPGHGTQSHGTGALQTYLTVDADGVERGYNTDFRPVQFDASSDTLATRALPLSNVPVVTVDGQQYREFVLNVDQIDANGDRQLSVDEIQIFTSTVNNLRNYNNANNTLRAGSLIETPIWSLDALDGSTNDWLQVRAMSNQGNRAGELALLIPNSLFNASEQFVYIYSRMGVNRDANAGAEQWGVRTAPPVDPPGNEPVSISGRVFRDVDPDGEEGPLEANGVYDEGIDIPISGVTIGFSGLSGMGENLFPGGDPEFTTGSDGTFTFDGPSAGTYQLIILGNTSALVPVGTAVGDADGDDILGEPEDGTGGTEDISNILLDGGAFGVDYGFLMGFGE